MTKCEICKEKVSTTFLNKVLGTIIYDQNNKKHIVCKNCQNKFNNDKAEMLKNI